MRSKNALSARRGQKVRSCLSLPLWRREFLTNQAALALHQIDTPVADVVQLPVQRARPGATTGRHDLLDHLTPFVAKPAQRVANQFQLLVIHGIPPSLAPSVHREERS